MKIIALGKPGKKFSPDSIQFHIKHEAGEIWDKYMKGVIREFYLLEDQPGAILILECKDVIEAKMYVEQLVFVKEELVEFTYYPLAPFKAIASLFEKS